MEPFGNMKKAMDPLSINMNVNTHMRNLTYDFREFIS